ncbi:MAG: sulfatase-like hydrolase/transferase [Chloroflexi bacterium]|nr:sulfatase-like hydrolase/transferase [Chloroflexota bacterium]
MSPTRGPRPPNVLVVLSDEHTPFATGCYGHPQVQTPHLDRLAADGTLFENAYCNSPMCVPSRLSLLSGRYVHQIGAWDNGTVPSADFTTWGHYLGAAGYETVLCGRTHWNGSDRLHGFERRLVDDRESWNEPVENQHPAIRHLRWSFRNDQPLPEELERRATASYWALVTFVDDLVGRLLDVIDGSPLRHNTVVLYTSDHGEMAGHHGIWQKQCFYEPSVRVPLLLRLPPRLDATGSWRGRRVAENVSLVDVLPTLLELAGAEVPPDLPGQSLLEVARQGADTPRRAVLSEYHAQGMLTGGFMLKRGDFKLCHYVGHAPQLFDVGADPLERRDLAADPAYASIGQELERNLRRIVDAEAADAQARADQEARRLHGRLAGRTGAQCPKRGALLREPGEQSVREKEDER